MTSMVAPHSWRDADPLQLHDYIEQTLLDAHYNLLLGKMASASLVPSAVDHRDAPTLPNAVADKARPLSARSKPVGASCWSQPKVHVPQRPASARAVPRRDEPRRVLQPERTVVTHRAAPSLPSHLDGESEVADTVSMLAVAAAEPIRRQRRKAPLPLWREPPSPSPRATAQTGTQPSTRRAVRHWQPVAKPGAKQGASTGERSETWMQSGAPKPQPSCMKMASPMQHEHTASIAGSMHMSMQAAAAAVGCSMHQAAARPAFAPSPVTLPLQSAAQDEGVPPTVERLSTSACHHEEDTPTRGDHDGGHEPTATPTASAAERAAWTRGADAHPEVGSTSRGSYRLPSSGVAKTVVGAQHRPPPPPLGAACSCTSTLEQEPGLARSNAAMGAWQREQAWRSEHRQRAALQAAAHFDGQQRSLRNRALKSVKDAAASPADQQASSAFAVHCRDLFRHRYHVPEKAHVPPTMGSQRSRRKKQSSWRVEDSIWAGRQFRDLEDRGFLDDDSVVARAIQRDFGKAQVGTSLPAYLLTHDSNAPAAGAPPDDVQAFFAGIEEACVANGRLFLMVFDYFATQSKTDDVFHVTRLGYDQMIQQCDLTVKGSTHCDLAHLDIIFVAVNSSSEKVMKGAMNGVARDASKGVSFPEHKRLKTMQQHDSRLALTRSELLQSLLRIAVARYILTPKTRATPKAGKTSVAEAVQELYRTLRARAKREVLQDSAQVGLGLGLGLG